MAHCSATAHEALRRLLADDVEGAEQCLRAELSGPTPPSDIAAACLQADLGLCALHSGRPAEAAATLRHALALLPPPELTSPHHVDPSRAWVPLARAQTHLNLCEALLVRGQLLQTVHSAREAIRHAQLAIPHHDATPRGETPGGMPTRGATPRLFAARWLAPHPRREAVVGFLAAPEALMLAWLWCAIAQESLGAYQEALRCYSRALGVAHIDRAAALAMCEQLKKKIALTGLASFGVTETTGLGGQRLEASDFKTEVPYATSVEGMLSSSTNTPSYRLPPPPALRSATTEPRTVSHHQRAAPQLAGRRAAGGSKAPTLTPGMIASAQPSAGVWTYIPGDVFGPPKRKHAAARPLFPQASSAVTLRYRQPPPRPGSAGNARSTSSSGQRSGADSAIASSCASRSPKQLPRQAWAEARQEYVPTATAADREGGRGQVDSDGRKEYVPSEARAVRRPVSASAALGTSASTSRPPSARPRPQSASFSRPGRGSDSKGKLSRIGTRSGTVSCAAPISESRSLSDSAGTKGAFGVYLLSHSEQLRHLAELNEKIQAESRRAAREARLEAAQRAAQTAAAAVEAAAASARRREALERLALLPAEDLVETMMRAAEADLRRAIHAGQRRTPKVIRQARRLLLRELHATLRRLTRVLAGAVDGRGVRVSATRAAMRALHQLREREARDGSLRRSRCIGSAIWLLEHGGVPELDAALRMLEWLLQNFDVSEEIDVEEEGEEEEEEEEQLPEQYATAPAPADDTPSEARPLPPRPIEIPEARRAAAARLMRRLAEAAAEARQEGKVQVVMELHLAPPPVLVARPAALSEPPKAQDGHGTLPPQSPTPLERRQAFELQKRKLEEEETSAAAAEARVEAELLLKEDNEERAALLEAAKRAREEAAAARAAERKALAKRAERELRHEKEKQDRLARQAFAREQAAQYWAQHDERVQQLKELHDAEHDARVAQAKRQRLRLETERAHVAKKMKGPRVEEDDECSATVALVPFELDGGNVPTNGTTVASVALRIFPCISSKKPGVELADRLEYVASDEGPPPKLLQTPARDPTVRLRPTREMLAFLEEVWTGFSLFAQQDPRDATGGGADIEGQLPLTIVPTLRADDKPDMMGASATHTEEELESMLASARQIRDNLTLEADRAELRVREMLQLSNTSEGDTDARELQLLQAARSTQVLRAAEAAEQASYIACQLAAMRRPSRPAEMPGGLFKAPPSPYSISHDGLLEGGGVVSEAELELVLETFGTNYLHRQSKERFLRTFRADDKSEPGDEDRYISFPYFVRVLVRALATPSLRLGDADAETNEDEYERSHGVVQEPVEMDIEALTAPLPAQSLASLFAAFRLFDAHGTGTISLDDVDLVLAAVDNHLSSTEIEQVQLLLASDGSTSQTTINFHQFISKLAPLNPTKPEETRMILKASAEEDVERLRIAVEEVRAHQEASSQAELSIRQAPELDEDEKALAYSAFKAFSTWVLPSPSEKILVPILPSEEVSLVLEALTLRRDDSEVLPLVKAAQSMQTVHSMDNDSGLSFEAFCAVYAVLLKSQHAEVSDKAPSEASDAEVADKGEIYVKSAMTSAETVVREAFLSFADEQETVTTDEMEMILKTIGIHRSLKELAVAWEAMGYANRTYLDDAYDTVRLPFEAFFTLLEKLNVSVLQIGGVATTM